MWPKLSILGKCIRSFAWGRLTFFETGLEVSRFGGCVWIFFESQDSQILPFQCVREFWPVAGRSVHTMINPYVVF